MNRQGDHVGTSYRSEIFYVSEAQRNEALRTIDDVDASGLWPGRVVTKVSPAGEFWEPESEHQDYLQLNPLGYIATSRARGGNCPGALVRLPKTHCKPKKADEAVQSNGGADYNGLSITDLRLDCLCPTDR